MQCPIIQIIHCPIQIIHSPIQIIHCPIQQSQLNSLPNSVDAMPNNSDNSLSNSDNSLSNSDNSLSNSDNSLPNSVDTLSIAQFSEFTTHLVAFREMHCITLYYILTFHFTAHDYKVLLMHEMHNILALHLNLHYTILYEKVVI